MHHCLTFVSNIVRLANWKRKSAAFAARPNAFSKGVEFFHIYILITIFAQVVISLKLSGTFKKGKLEKLLFATPPTKVAVAVFVSTFHLVDERRENVGRKLSCCRAFCAHALEVSSFSERATPPAPAYLGVSTFRNHAFLSCRL